MSDAKTEAQSNLPTGQPSAAKATVSVCENCGRREFFSRLGLGSLVVAAAGSGLFTYEYFSPNVLFEAPPVVKAGRPDEFPAGSVTLDPQSGIYMINGPKGYYALGAVCTHLGCLTAWKPDLDLIACPCHGSRFNRDGVKVAGPAPQPLPWLKVRLSDDGYLMVDRSNVLKAQEFVKV